MNASQRSRMVMQQDNMAEDRQWQLDSNYDPAEDPNISRISREGLNSRMSGQRAGKVDYTWRINARNNIR